MTELDDPFVKSQLDNQLVDEAERVNGHDGGTHSWRPLDLDGILTGTYEPPAPTVGARDDGTSVLYPGRRHDAYGESESGKTWFALLIAIHELNAGHNVVYLDFEDDAGAFVARLQALGATQDQIRDQFAYIHPDEPLDAPGNTRDLDQALGDLHPTVGVVDGVTEAMTMHGFDLRDNIEIAKFGRLVPGRIAASGAASLCLDHVTKDRETGRRYAIGGQHKLAGLNGAAFLVENRTAFGIGMTGRSSIYLTKDRPAGLRRHALPSSGGLHWFGDLVVGPVDKQWPDVLDGAIAAPARREPDWRPTELMTRVSEAMQKSNSELNMQGILDRVHGKRSADVRKAVSALVDDGFIEVTEGPRGAKVHRLVRPFTTEDPGTNDA